MEEGQITIARSRGSVCLPCDFTLVACSNPCPCGFLGDRKGVCTCRPPQIARYRRKFSGPILDRIDLFVRLFSPQAKQTDYLKMGEKLSPKIRSRVEEVRQVQRERFKDEKITINARMDNNLIKKFCQLNGASCEMLERATSCFNLSPRSIYKIIKVARTIADMERSAGITAAHIAEAIQYKCESLKY